MEKEFITYEQALALKELGFNEPCLAHLIGFGDGTIENGRYKIIQQQVFYPNDYTTSNDKAEELGLNPFGMCGVPLFQQSFRFFREKYSLVHEIKWSKYKGGLEFDYDIFSLVLPTDDELGDEDDIASDKSMETYDSLVEKDFKHKSSETYEEAELACLIKLIEICKNK